MEIQGSDSVIIIEGIIPHCFFLHLMISQKIALCVKTMLHFIFHTKGKISESYFTGVIVTETAVRMTATTIYLRCSETTFCDQELCEHIK